MDMMDYLKKCGKSFLKSASRYSKHKPQLIELPVDIYSTGSDAKKVQSRQNDKPINAEKTEPEQEKRNDHEKDFIKLFQQLTYSHRPIDVWSDFVTMFACAISNSVDKTNFDIREKTYLSIISKYTKSEQQIFPQLVAKTVLSLDQNTEQDFLGRIYMNLNLSNKSASQFFTPYHVCELMAKISMDNIVSNVKENGYISINDPTCGAGATLIAGINEAKKRLEKSNINFQNHVFVVGQDIDAVVAMMCYIQISLLGVAGYVKVGNSLTNPISESDETDSYWFTPMYFSSIWTTRRILKKLGKDDVHGNTVT